MRIISIEGLDKSGKHTLSNTLSESLRNKGFRVEQSEFHRYDTPTGKLIQDWLTSKYDVDQLTIELIMAADKQAQQQWIQSLEDEGIDFLILDRYTWSQRVYAEASGVSKSFIGALQTNLRQPDHTILLDIPAEVSMSRKGKHNDGVNDRYESDLHLLRKVRKIYVQAVGSNDIIIDASMEYRDILHEAKRFLQLKYPSSEVMT